MRRILERKWRVLDLLTSVLTQIAVLISLSGFLTEAWGFSCGELFSNSRVDTRVPHIRAQLLGARDYPEEEFFWDLLLDENYRRAGKPRGPSSLFDKDERLVHDQFDQFLRGAEVVLGENYQGTNSLRSVIQRRLQRRLGAARPERIRDVVLEVQEAYLNALMEVIRTHAQHARSYRESLLFIESIRENGGGLIEKADAARLTFEYDQISAEIESLQGKKRAYERGEELELEIPYHEIGQKISELRAQLDSIGKEQRAALDEGPLPPVEGENAATINTINTRLSELRKERNQLRTDYDVHFKTFYLEKIRLELIYELLGERHGQTEWGVHRDALMAFKDFFIDHSFYFQVNRAFEGLHRNLYEREDLTLLASDIRGAQRLADQFDSVRDLGNLWLLLNAEIAEIAGKEMDRRYRRWAWGEYAISVGWENVVVPLASGNLGETARGLLKKAKLKKTEPETPTHPSPTPKGSGGGAKGEPKKVKGKSPTSQVLAQLREPSEGETGRETDPQPWEQAARAAQSELESPEAREVYSILNSRVATFGVEALNPHERPLYERLSELHAPKPEPQGKKQGIIGGASLMAIFTALEKGDVTSVVETLLGFFQ